MKLSATRSLPPDADILVFVALGVAIGFVVVRWLWKMRSKFRLDESMGPLNWDFSNSWASTLTAVGALLGTILSAGVLPEPTQRLSSAAFAGLDLLFAVLIVIAALVYNGFRRAKKVITTGGPETQYQGYVGLFLVASAITLWAVLGELATMFLLLAEIGAAGSMSALAILVFQSVLVVAVVLLLVYAWRTVYWTVDAQTDSEARQAAKQRLYAQMRVSGVLEALRSEDKKLLPPLPACAML